MAYHEARVASLLSKWNRQFFCTQDNKGAGIHASLVWGVDMIHEVDLCFTLKFELCCCGPALPRTPLLVASSFAPYKLGVKAEPQSVIGDRKAHQP